MSVPQQYKTCQIADVSKSKFPASYSEHKNVKATPLFLDK